MNTDYKALTLIRNYLDNCCIGSLHHIGQRILYTVEKPYLSNKPFHSAVPPGIYSLAQHDSNSHPNSLIFWNHDLGVGKYKGDSIRYGCLFHIANFPKDVVGCIGPGLKLHPTDWGVMSSGDAMEILTKLVTTNDWKLEIV